MNKNEQLQAIDEKVEESIKRVDSFAQEQKDAIRAAGEEAKREVMQETDGAREPRFGDEYWYIDSCGNVTEDSWCDDSMDEARYALCNCYPTEAAAEHARDCLRWKAAYKRRGRKLPLKKGNHVAYWRNNRKEIDGATYGEANFGFEAYFYSGGELQNAVDATCAEMDGTREDFARYVLGVENESRTN